MVDMPRLRKFEQIFWSIYLACAVAFFSATAAASECTVSAHETTVLALRASVLALVGRGNDVFETYEKLNENANQKTNSLSVRPADLKILGGRLNLAHSALNEQNLPSHVEHEFRERQSLIDCENLKSQASQLQSPCIELFASYDQTISELNAQTNELRTIIADTDHKALTGTEHSDPAPTVETDLNLTTSEFDKLTQQLNLVNEKNRNLQLIFSQELEARYQLYNCVQNQGAFSSLILLIDTSGSMAGVKLASAKNAAINTIRKAIKRGAEISVLAFGGNCKSPINSRVNFSRNEGGLIAFVKGLSARGGTPLSTALNATAQFMNKNKSDQSKAQMIIVLADGDNDNNCGRIDEQLDYLDRNDLLYQHETVGLEVSASTIRQLERIADRSGGNYHNATSATLSDLFSDVINQWRLFKE